MSSFKYKWNIIGNLIVVGTKNNVKIVLPLKYLNNFWISLEILLINCRVELSLGLYQKCILSSAGNSAAFTITDAKLDVAIVCLSAEHNKKLSKLLSEGFKRPVHWSEYKVISNRIVEIAANNEEKDTRELLDSSGQGFTRLLATKLQHWNWWKKLVWSSN